MKPLMTLTLLLFGTASAASLHPKTIASFKDLLVAQGAVQSSKVLPLCQSLNLQPHNGKWESWVVPMHTAFFEQNLVFDLKNFDARFGDNPVPYPDRVEDYREDKVGPFRLYALDFKPKTVAEGGAGIVLYVDEFDKYTTHLCVRY